MDGSDQMGSGEEASRARRNARWVKLARQLSSAGSVLAISAGILAVIMTASTFSYSLATAEHRDRISLLERDLAMAMNELARLKILPNNTSLPGGDASSEDDANNLLASVAEVRELGYNLDERLGRLEGAILQNPEKALSVPLLRRDLDNLERSYASGVESLRAEVERIYGVAKWFGGLILAMVIGVAINSASKLIDGRLRKAV